MPSGVGGEDPEGTSAGTGDRPEVALIEGQQVERVIALGQDDDRRVGQAKVERYGSAR